MEPHTLVLSQNGALRAFAGVLGLGQFIQRLRLFLPLLGEKFVLRNTAQPGLHPAVPAKAVDGLHGLEKGLLGQLLRRVHIPGQAQGVAVDRVKILPVQRFKLPVGHILTSSFSWTREKRKSYRQFNFFLLEKAVAPGIYVKA